MQSSWKWAWVLLFGVALGCGTGRPGPGSGGGRDASTDRGAMGDGAVDDSCEPACGDGMICCGGRCIARDVDNCTGCGIGCDPTTANSCAPREGSSSYECRCGAAPQCPSGTACVVEGGAPRCVDLQTDRNNCGMLGRVCAEGEICVGGNCSCGGASCSDGQSCCGGACVDTQSDPNNCGACGNACQEGEACVAGACVCGSGPGARACAPRTDSSLGELCCDGTCVPQDENNCGSCGTTCSDGSMCILGMDLTGGSTRVCCGMGLGGGVPIPGLGGGICDLGGGLPGLDGGLPGLDGGLPGLDGGI